MSAPPLRDEWEHADLIAYLALSSLVQNPEPRLPLAPQEKARAGDTVLQRRHHRVFRARNHNRVHGSDVSRQFTSCA
jgi:hypothetical protein